MGLVEAAAIDMMKIEKIRISMIFKKLSLLRVAHGNRWCEVNEDIRKCDPYCQRSYAHRLSISSHAFASTPKNHQPCDLNEGYPNPSLGLVSLVVVPEELNQVFLLIYTNQYT